MKESKWDPLVVVPLSDTPINFEREGVCMAKTNVLYVPTFTNSWLISRNEICMIYSYGSILIDAFFLTVDIHSLPSTFLAPMLPLIGMRVCSEADYRVFTVSATLIGCRDH